MVGNWTYTGLYYESSGDLLSSEFGGSGNQ